MPVYQVLRQEQPEDLLQLKAQLKVELTECAEVRATYRNKVAAFMAVSYTHLLYRVRR